MLFLLLCLFVLLFIVLVVFGSALVKFVVMVVLVMASNMLIPTTSLLCLLCPYWGSSSLQGLVWKAPREHLEAHNLLRRAVVGMIGALKMGLPKTKKHQMCINVVEPMYPDNKP